MAKAAVRRVNSRTNNNKRYTAARINAGAGVITRRRAAERRYRNTATARSRTRTLSLNKSYIIFLILVCAATVFMCIQFLQLKSEIKSQNDRNAALESQLLTMKAENDAYYESVMNSLDLTDIKNIAVTRYGMHYASQDQIIWYNADNSGYVRQMHEVPAG